MVAGPPRGGRTGSGLQADSSTLARPCDPQVVSDLPLPDTDRADLTVTATVRNRGDAPVTVEVAGSIGSIAFSAPVALDPGESTLVTFDPAAYPQLHLEPTRRCGGRTRWVTSRWRSSR